MSIKIVKDGKELEIREALEYLGRAYGIPPAHIAGVMVDGRVGKPMMITVTMYVQREDADTKDVVPAGSADDPSPGEQLRAGLPGPSDTWGAR